MNMSKAGFLDPAFFVAKKFNYYEYPARNKYTLTK